MVVEKDVDLETIERSGQFNGRYFVLGGLVPILEKDPENRVRSRELISEFSNYLAFDFKARPLPLIMKEWKICFNNWCRAHSDLKVR